MALLECSGCGGMVSDNTDFCSQCGTVIEKASKSKRLRLVAVVILFPLAIVTIASMNSGNFLRTFTQNEVVQTESEKRPIRSAPILGHKIRSLAIKLMRENKVVVDAAINQTGDELSFLLIVQQSTSTAEAATLGEDFVRVLESAIGGAAAAGEEISQSDYRYLIGVYTPDQNRIAVAFKGRDQKSLDW